MTVDWCNLIDRVRFNFPFPLRVLWDDATQTIWCEYDVISNNAPWRPTTIRLYQHRPPEMRSEAEALGWLRWIAWLSLLHEVEENMLYKGVKIFDPHVAAPAPPYDWVSEWIWVLLGIGGIRRRA